jgi:serine/threonine protein kinase
VSALAQALADRYRIERELGQGGMAMVYLAEDLKHHRKVAVKVLRPELAAVIGAERFLREIKTTANLQHPHILPLFDSGIASAAAQSPNTSSTSEDNWDVGPDGQFLMIRADPATRGQFLAVLNWFEELQPKVGGQR